MDFSLNSTNPNLTLTSPVVYRPNGLSPKRLYDTRDAAGVLWLNVKADQVAFWRKSYQTGQLHCRAY